MTLSYMFPNIYGTTNDRRGTTWNIPAGWIFNETDLPFQRFRWSGTAWIQINGRGYNTNRKHGGFNGAGYEGILANVTITENGNVANVNSTIGRYRTYTTGTTNLDSAGLRVNSITYRKFNPYLKFKARPNTSTVQDGWFGFTSSTTDPTGDTEATAKSFFAVGFRTTDTNYQIIRNDGSTPATYVDTGVVVNTTLRTWELVGDETGTRWGWAVDGGAFTYYTTIIPAITTLLTLIMHMELSSGGVARSFDISAFDIEFDT
jgi:hypothetical protein